MAGTLMNNSGIDFRKSMAYLFNDEKTYRQILCSYKDEFVTKKEEVLKLFSFGDVHSLVDCVRGLKPAASAVGADALCSLLTDVELAGKDCNLLLIAQSLTPLLFMLDSVCDSISRYLEFENDKYTASYSEITYQF